jgi:hypothetical protein
MTSAHCHLDPNTEILDKARTDDGSSAADETIMSDKRSVVVIVGGGFLAQSSLRVSVFVQWVWTYFTGQRGSRLIVNHRGT